MSIQENSLREAGPLGRRQRAERQRRQRARRVGIVAALFALVLALAIPAVGYYAVFVRPLRQPALLVNDRVYSWGDYLQRTRMLIAQAQAQGVWQPDTLNGLIFDMLDEMERQEIIRQYAGQEGIKATPEEINQEVRVRILGQSGATDANIPESEFQERYRRRLDLLKVDERDFESVAELAILRRKFEEHLKDRVPAQALHRHLFLIQVSEIEDARKVLARIDGGEDFEKVAREVSRDPRAKDTGGDIGWVPERIKEEYDSVLFDLKDGEVSPPIFGQAGVYVIKAVGVAEARDISEDHRSTLRTRALDDWILQRRSELAAKGDLSRPGGGMTSERYNWVLTQLTQDRDLFPRRGDGA